MLCKALANIGLKKSEANSAVFYVHHETKIAILACHIDDCMITGSSQKLIQDYKDKLKAKYSLMDLEPTNWLLGIKIVRNLKTRTTSLSQISYIKSILMKFNFINLKPSSTLMDRDQHPKTIEEMANMWKVPYQEAIGSLNYCAVATWPDFAFSVSLLVQFIDNPGRIHWEGVKWVLCYLLGMKD